MNNPIKPLVIFIVALAGLLYAFSICYAGYLSLNEKTTMEPLLATLVTCIGGILSTNLGAVLGVTINPPATTDTKPPERFMGFNSSFQANEGENKVDTAQKTQIMACWVYVGSLILALVFWVIGKLHSISDDKMIPLIPELVKTLIGVFVGALTVGLGRR